MPDGIISTCSKPSQSAVAEKWLRSDGCQRACQRLRARGPKFVYDSKMKRIRSAGRSWHATISQRETLDLERRVNWVAEIVPAYQRGGAALVPSPPCSYPIRLFQLSCKRMRLFIAAAKTDGVFNLGQIIARWLQLGGSLCTIAFAVFL
jgi:hypothetical protein